uniref:Bacteriophage phiJL001 Gp84 C-terminal domain-containing protein n=1 Tax=viral metagenome TaxID=1070528 RepID=A0A6M3L3F5_9ZZZZ
MAECFRFYMGSQEWAYTSDRREIAIGPTTYSPKAIQRSELNFEFEKQEISIKMPYDLSPADLFILFNPSTVLWLEIKKSSGALVFVGKIVSCSFDIDLAEATMKAISIQALMKGKIPTRTYGASCPHELFDSGCGLSSATWAVLLNTSSVTLDSGRRIFTSAAIGGYASQYFAGGYVTLSYQSSYIINQTGGQITLLFPLLLWADDMSLTVYPGCDKTLSTCENKYNNIINYGGCPWIPTRNVMTQGF